MTYRYRSGVRRLTYDARDNNSTTTQYVKNQGNFSSSDASQDFASGAGFTDPLDASTFLLLQADGRASGSTNNTLLDSSSTNASFTRNGNATQGSFSPFSNTWSLQFPFSSTSYVDITNNASLNVGSSNFTIEAWAFPFSRHNGAIYGQWNTANSAQRQFLVYITSTGYVTALFTDVAGTSYSVTSTTQYAASTWMHIAFVRNNNVFTLYVNGQASGTPVTMIYGTQVCTNNYRIGDVTNAGTFPFQGYISNVRQVNGTALYTSNFTVPTGPLPAVSGTVLLMAASPNCTINKGSLSLTAVNTGTKTTRFSPFPSNTGGTSFGANGGSGFFDGTGDYFSSTTSTSDLNLDGDFTIEGWIYPTASLASKRFLGNGGAGTGANLYLDSASYFYMATYTPSLIYIQANLAPFFDLNTWTHFAICRQGTTLYMFRNGVSMSFVTGGAVGTTAFSFNQPWIGAAAADSGANSLPGFLSGIRIVKGTALYTSAFTPPTAPPTAVSGTSLLCNFTNAGIYDASSNMVFETSGNVSVGTLNYTPPKYGSGAIYFPAGTTDYLTLPANNLYALNDNFTIEFWMYPFRVTTLAGIMGTGTSAVPIGWKIELTTSSYLQYVDGSVTVTQTMPPLMQYAWYHVAVVRQRTATTNTTVLYLNGNAVASSTTAYSLFNAGNYYPLYIGAGWSGANPFRGMLDEIRISQVARYQGPFTPPPRGYPPQ